jgi:hypothetical protein
MIGPLSPATATRLEKAAIDNGFDQGLPCDAGWLGFASTQAPPRIWLTTLGEDRFLVTFSQAHVAHALADHGTPTTARGWPAGLAKPVAVRYVFYGIFLTEANP